MSMSSWLKSCEYSVCYNFDFNYRIKRFCTCQDSWNVIKFARFWLHMMIIFKSEAHLILRDLSYELTHPLWNGSLNEFISNMPEVLLLLGNRILRTVPTVNTQFKWRISHEICTRSRCALFCCGYIHLISLAESKTAVSPSLTHWRYYSLALSYV